MQSLLSRYYHRIKGSAEDIASESLSVFLNESRGSNSGFRDFVQRQTSIELHALTFVSQVSGDHGERPDISGYDSDNEEKVIIEAKFWASLTDNQPVTYLNRLDTNGILVFVCPTQRILSLTHELERRLKIAEIPVTKFKQDTIISTYQVNRDKFLIVTSWTNILAMIRDSVVQEQNRNLLSDLDQISGLCERIDMDAMLPIRSEDLSPSLPRTILSYYTIVDNVITELDNKKVILIKGLKTTPQKYGYTRYFRSGDLCGGLEVHFQLWRYHGDSPFWLNVGLIEQDGRWNMQAPIVKKACKATALKLNYRYVDSDGGSFHFALFPKTGQTEDQVQLDLITQFRQLLEEITLYINNQ